MALTGAHAPGATPLSEEDIAGLKLANITTQGELNEAEAGNGRHARMLAHMAMTRHFDMKPLPWGGSRLRDADATRKAYIDALVAADNRDFGPLLLFARHDG